jgi:long-subunit fatty acid transport protein
MTARAGAILLALLLLAGAPASAQIGTVFNRPGSGARAAGMANAFIAVSDDGTAASWNPAGLGQLRKPELSVVSSTIGRSIDANGFRTLDDRAAFTNAHSSYQSTYLDFASLAVPVTLFKKPVTFQGSWRRLYTLDYREVLSVTRVPVAADGPPPLRADINDELVGSVNVFSFAGAVKLTSRLSLGGTYNHWQGDWAENQAFSQTPLPVPTGPSAFRTVSQTNSVRGDSFSGGLMLTYPGWSVGVVYQGALDADFTGTQQQIATDSEPVPFGETRGTLHFPKSIGAGAAWRPDPRWTVALDFTWDEWTEATIDTPEIGHINFLDGLPPDRTSSQNTLAINAGAEHLFFGESFVVPVRFGAAWEPQGARDPYTRDPVNFAMLAMGTGYNTNSLKFDAAFQYRWASYKSGGDFGVLPRPSEIPLAVGERKSKEWRLKFSLIVRITDTEKLHRTLKKIFGSDS